MKLIPMTDFCLEILNGNPPYNEVAMLTKISNYANFLKQPLTLGMFVPVDEEGNVLQEPHLGMFHDNRAPLRDLNLAKNEYEKSKEKVLFEGFVVDKFGFKDQYYVKKDDCIYPFPNVRGFTIEDLTNYDLELMETAMKQIAL